MILAGIDIGTNSLRLIIVETGPDAFRERYSARRTTRLGKDLDRTGRLSSDAMERSFSVLSEFSVHIRRFSACQTSAIGTSALRNASNANEFIAEARRRTGIDISVVSGEMERYAYKDMLVSDGGLREGIMADLAAKQSRTPAIKDE